MNELSVFGREIYPGYELKICILPFDKVTSDAGLYSRYRCLFITQGNGVIQINNRLYPVVAPAICCLNEQDHLSIHSQDNISGNYLFFHPMVLNPNFEFENLWNADKYEHILHSLDYWFLRPFINKKNNYEGYISIDSSLGKRVSGMMDIMNLLLHDQPDDGWPCRTRSYLIELLLILSRLYDFSKMDAISYVNVSEESIWPVILYLAGNYNKKIKIDDLTKLFHINKTSLNEHFKKATGMSVTAYLISVRMQIACSILKNTLVPVSEIMNRVGFSDDAHFLRTFKKYAGITPTEYRNMNCWMLEKEIH